MRHFKTKSWIILLIFFLLPCQNAMAVGPFDYNDPELRKQWIGNVEGNHFNKDVEELRQGMTGTIFDDLRYTLRIFPNHHRALYSLSRLYQREPHPFVSRGGRTERTAESFFERAIKFAPNDAVVYLIYAIHLHKLNKLKAAAEKYKMAVELKPEYAEAHYNLGLLYADMKDYKKAYISAKKAYDLGFPLAGLKNRLKKVGAWK